MRFRVLSAILAAASLLHHDPDLRTGLQGMGAEIAALELANRPMSHPEAPRA